MKRVLFLICSLLLLVLGLQAQKLTVESMTVATNDISASTSRRMDLNGQPCGLVKVQLATSGAVFDGNIIKPVEYKTGEYWVYMTDGAYMLQIKHPNFLPLELNFRDYGIKKVQSLTTYKLVITMPQGNIPEIKQKLIVDYSPATATVLIDQNLERGNGHIELELPVGDHSYVITADGYEPAIGSVRLSASSPRRVNETLVRQQGMTQQSAVVSQQQTTVPQQPANVQPSPNAEIETITVKGVSFNMIRVEGGTFTMGATSEQGSDAWDDEKPTHRVTLSTYYLGETEVTQALWEAVMGSNPFNWKGPNLPVESVSWDDCQEFIRRLNRETSKEFRLPTEAEWECAARGGQKSKGYKYSGSNTIGDVAWYDGNSGNKTHVVKTKQPNELGLYDMSGNVWEWCEDWYGSYSSSSQTNPTGPSKASRRVNRGGSWFSLARYCRVSHRGSYSPGFRYGNLGLRLAL